MRVAVLGAGVAGLVAARRLAREGHDALVLERWPGLGGQAATIDVGRGHLLERYYHHWFTSDAHMRALCEELGVAIEWLPSRIGFLLPDGRVLPFTTPGDLLRFDALPLRDRVRMGVAVLRLQRSRRPLAHFERETARSWIEREMGRNAWRVVWGPLLRGKFGDRADDISMAWLWGKLTLRRPLKGEEARKELLGYPTASFEDLLARLRDDVEAHGGEVRIDAPARAVHRDGEGWRVEVAAPGAFRAGHDPSRFAPGGEERVDAVVATVPNDVFLQLVDEEQLAPGFADRLRHIEYHAALCLLLELDRPVGGFYWTNVADDAVPFVGFVEHTNFVGAERYDGRRFAYVANYVDRSDPRLGWSADELLASYEPGLRRIRPDWDPAWVKASWLHREPAAQPVVTVGYERLVPPLQTGAPGLVLANTTSIYPEDRGTNYAVRLGEQAAAAVLGR